MTTKRIPEVDLIDQDRLRLRDTLKEGLELGFFYVKNFDSILDQNIISLVFEQAGPIFTENNKQSFNINKSNCFSGLCSISAPNDILLDQLNLHFGSSNDDPRYKCLFGPNQIPSKPKLLEKSLTQLVSELNPVTSKIWETILQILSDDDSPSDFGLSPTFSEVKISREANEPFPTRDFISENDDSLAYMNLIFQPPALKVQDIYGTWIDSPSKPNQIAVSVGGLLEILSGGVFVSGKYKLSTRSTMSLFYSPFFDLNTKLAPLEISETLMIDKAERDKVPNRLQYLVLRESDNCLGEELLHQRVKQYRSVSKIHYPQLLARLDALSRYKNSNQSKKSSDLEVIIKRLNKALFAFDKTVPLLIGIRTSNIKVSEVLSQIKNIAKFLVTEKDLLQITYIWPGSLCLLLNEYGDLLIDSDKAKDALGLRNLSTRTKTFKERSYKWLENNKTQDDVPLFSRDHIDLFRETSDKKRVKREIVQNSKERFTAKPKAQTEQKGLSLLERIKQKELQAAENRVSPEAKYEKFLEGKLKSVLEIILSMKFNTPYVVDNLAETIRNSLTKNPVSEKEAFDSVIYLNKKFPELFKLVETKDTKIVKWPELDREQLLNNVYK